MNRVVSVIFILFASIVVHSCTKNEYVRQSYDKIYQIKDVMIRHVGNAILITPVCDEFDIEKDGISRAFYTNVDTALVFWGYRRKDNSKNGALSNLCAVDWRLQSITVEALEMYSQEYLAGDILNDVLEVCYYYKKTKTTIPLISFNYGALMLADYYPGLPEWPESVLSIQITKGGEPLLPPVRIRIADAFGREFWKIVMPEGYSTPNN